MKSLLRLFLFVVLLIPLLALAGCATTEQDADDVANNVVKGLEGKGQLYNEKVMKGDMGAFGNDFQ
ncbi:MAG: hypothetical protein RLZZ408_1096 [Verrucomicrobiota bacterium]